MTSAAAVVTIGSARAPPTRSTADTATTGCKAAPAQICSSAAPATTSSMAGPAPTTPASQSPREPCDHRHQRNISGTGADRKRRHRHGYRRRVRGLLDGRYSVADLLSPPANRSPVAAGDSASTPPDLAVVVKVLANDTDADGDELDVTSVELARAWHGDGARRRISGSMRLRQDSMATTASPTRCPTDEAARIRRACRSRCCHRLPATRSGAASPRRPRGAGSRSTSTASRRSGLRCSSARDVNGVTARRPAQDHHGVELDGLGSESQSAHHLGRRSRQLCWQRRLPF